MHTEIDGGSHQDVSDDEFEMVDHEPEQQDSEEKQTQTEDTTLQSLQAEIARLTQENHKLTTDTQSQQVSINTLLEEKNKLDAEVEAQASEIAKLSLEKVTLSVELASQKAEDEDFDRKIQNIPTELDNACEEFFDQTVNANNKKNETAALLIQKQWAGYKAGKLLKTFAEDKDYPTLKKQHQGLKSEEYDLRQLIEQKLFKTGEKVRYPAIHETNFHDAIKENLALAQEINNQHTRITSQYSLFNKSENEWWDNNFKDNAAWKGFDKWNELRKKHAERSAETASLYEKQIATGVKVIDVLQTIRDKTSTKLGGTLENRDVVTFHK